MLDQLFLLEMQTTSVWSREFPSYYGHCIYEKAAARRVHSYIHKQSSFSNFSITSPTPQLILQPFRHFTYVTAHSPTLPLLHLRRSSFSNPSFASPTSQALHLIHLARRPWNITRNKFKWNKHLDKNLYNIQRVWKKCINTSSEEKTMLS